MFCVLVVSACSATRLLRSPRMAEKRPPPPRAADVWTSRNFTAEDEVLPQSFFEGLDYETDTVQWDLFGQPQRAVRLAAEEVAFGPMGTTILDCGCGAGDNANYLAERGYDVLGFDVSASAVETARKRSDGSSTTGAVELMRASATELGAAARVQECATELGGFAVALDSALLHCLDDEAQIAYVDGVRALMRPGGSLYLGCFSDGNPDPWVNPRASLTHLT
jgi:SAM-dependent methyltransferase